MPENDEQKKFSNKNLKSTMKGLRPGHLNTNRPKSAAGISTPKKVSSQQVSSERPKSAVTHGKNGNHAFSNPQQNQKEWNDYDIKTAKSKLEEIIGDYKTNDYFKRFHRVLRSLITIVTNPDAEEKEKEEIFKRILRDTSNLAEYHSRIKGRLIPDTNIRSVKAYLSDYLIEALLYLDKNHDDKKVINFFAEMNGGQKTPIPTQAEADETQGDVNRELKLTLAQINARTSLSPNKTIPLLEKARTKIETELSGKDLKQHSDLIQKFLCKSNPSSKSNSYLGNDERNIVFKVFSKTFFSNKALNPALVIASNDTLAKTCLEEAAESYICNRDELQKIITQHHETREAEGTNHPQSPKKPTTDPTPVKGATIQSPLLPEKNR